MSGLLSDSWTEDWVCPEFRSRVRIELDEAYRRALEILGAEPFERTMEGWGDRCGHCHCLASLSTYGCPGCEERHRLAAAA